MDLTPLAKLIASVVAKLASFRVIMAVVTSTAVTASVTGPLAIQAINARDLETTAPPTTIVAVNGSISPDGPRPTIIATTSTTSTTTSTTSTTTTLPPIPTTRPRVIPPGPTVPPPTIPPPTPTTIQAPVLTPFVSVSVSPERTESSLLDGTRITGDVYVFFARNASAVSWYLDGTEADNLAGVATKTPFDYRVDANQIPAPLATRTLTNGVHKIIAKVKSVSSAVEEIFIATFEVTNTK